MQYNLVIMKTNIFSQIALLAVVIVAVSCTPQKKLPKIAIAGIKIESSTFSPARSTEESFNVAIGDEIYDMIPYIATILVLVFTSMHENKEHAQPKSCGINYFREER